MPPADLVEDLIVRPDACFGDPERLVCRAMPRHLRLYVAGWMLWSGDDSRDARVSALREAHRLYAMSGRGLLDQPRLLTTADIVAEVLQLTEPAHQWLEGQLPPGCARGSAPENDVGQRKETR
jgi:hypothetical protein